MASKRPGDAGDGFHKAIVEITVSGISVGTATTCTNPIDVVKTRLQLRPNPTASATPSASGLSAAPAAPFTAASAAPPAANAAAGGPQMAPVPRGPIHPASPLSQPRQRPPGLVSTAAAIAREEGVGALWKGLPPALARGFVYGGLRLGLYGPVKQALAALAAPSGVQQVSPGSPESPAVPVAVTRAAAGGSASGATRSSAATASSGSVVAHSVAAGAAAAAGGGGSSSSSASSATSRTASSGTGSAPLSSFWTKLLAGSLSGGFAAAIASPTELIKTRMQASGGRMQQSSLAVARSVVAADGVAGLWRGAVPGLVRASVLTASQCATYDEIKGYIMRSQGWGDGLATHLGASLATGLISTTLTNPVDVVKTVMFVSGGRGSGSSSSNGSSGGSGGRGSAAALGAPAASAACGPSGAAPATSVGATAAAGAGAASGRQGVLACAAGILARDGPRGFLRGWSANYARLGPQTVITFVVNEKLRAWAGLGSF